jgi:hypothetical protein
MVGPAHRSLAVRSGTASPGNLHARVIEDASGAVLKAVAGVDCFLWWMVVMTIVG